MEEGELRYYLDGAKPTVDLSSLYYTDSISDYSTSEKNSSSSENTTLHQEQLKLTKNNYEIKQFENLQQEYVQEKQKCFTQDEESFQVLMIEKQPLPTGLPNIGNTCHLNALIQFIFSASKYRSIMLSLRKKAHQKSTVRLIGNLFSILSKSMKKNAKNKQHTIKKTKKKLLKQFVMNLEQMNLSYKRYQQQDVFETLNNILHNLECPLGQQQKITQLFSITSEKQCSCMEEPITMQSVYFTKDQKCETCKQNFKQTNLNAPQYLLVVSAPIEQKMTFSEGSQLNIKTHEYKFVSSIIYKGNGRSGHYYCFRKHNGKFYELNDSSVYEKNFNQLKESSSDKHRETPKSIVTLYQRQDEESSGQISMGNCEEVESSESEWQQLGSGQQYKQYLRNLFAKCLEKTGIFFNEYGEQIYVAALTIGIFWAIMYPKP